MEKFTKWVAAWGNATSIRDQIECLYAKDVTLRYPVWMPFDGDRMRLRFSNLTGKEPVKLRAFVSLVANNETILPETQKPVTVGGEETFTVLPGKEVESDELEMEIVAGRLLGVDIYLEDYTQLNSGVQITGPMSYGWYSYGMHANDEILPLDETRRLSWIYFLNTIDVHTEEKNHAMVLYGDSITAQGWPDELSLKAWREGYHDISFIRRAVSGTRILRQYDNITYAAYGLKGSVRFPIEMNTCGADTVLVQHGINDIIHPVGVDVNPFRPMSDLPSAEDMIKGYEEIYIRYARSLGWKIYGGTLLPIKGWRTYAPFREDLKNEFNKWLRETPLLDGCVDFEKKVMDPEDPAAFYPEYDSGDHLHPSKAGYQAMAECVMESLIRPKERKS